jgi:hypothetical protein
VGEAHASTLSGKRYFRFRKFSKHAKLRVGMESSNEHIPRCSPRAIAKSANCTRSNAQVRGTAEKFGFGVLFVMPGVMRQLHVLS